MLGPRVRRCFVEVAYYTCKCLLTADGFQTLPEVLGDTQTTLVTTRLYVPKQIGIIADHELQALEVIPSEIRQLDDIKFQVATPYQVVGMNSHLHASRASDRRENSHTGTLLYS